MAPETPAAQARRWSLVDLGAAAAVLLAAAGVIWSPKLSGAVAQATGGLVPVTVLVDVRGVPVADPEALVAAARQEGKVAIVIRNQPHGTVSIREIRPLQRRLVAVQPDGSVVTAVDPSGKDFSNLDARFVLEAQGLKGSGGVVFGSQSVKVGSPIEIEGEGYRVTGNVTGIAVQGG
ncbi:MULTISPECIES: DUF4330 domain-containing protein [Aphanothece]|uniref:DUF4330 domain-containing protein n=1 Tax=Aphanothece TaxID=1121 RepID=UPI0039855F9C